MSTREIATSNQMQEGTIPEKNQYALWQINGIWLAAGAPMWLLGWLVYPALSVNLPALEAGFLRMQLMAAGLIWQFVLSMLILYYEEGNIRLDTIRRRFWLNHPVSACTGETKKALWWWIIPMILLVAFLEVGLRSALVNLWTTIYPLFAEPKGYDMAELFSLRLSAQAFEVWGLLGLFFVNALFNTVLGEELLFRGVLLPKMEGLFGKWDWVANGVIFGFYHLHQPWSIPSSILTGLIYAFTAKRFRSNWIAIIIHGVDGILVLVTIMLPLWE